MRARIGRALGGAFAATSLLAGSVAGAPAASAAPIVNDADWVKGELSSNTYLYCSGLCFTYTMVSSNVNFQGPIGNVGAVPKVGDRFYLHVYTAVVSPFTLNDSYQMRLLLPEGLKVDIRSSTDVQCAITDTSFNLTRSMPGAECQDPVRSGLYDQFPAVALSRGEVANFFVPVVADRTFTKNQTIGLVSDLMTNPYTLLPDPLYSTNNQLVVQAAPPGTNPGPGPGPNPGTNPGPGTGTPTPATSVTAKAVAKKSKLKISVTPDLGPGKPWTATVKVKKGARWKRVPGSYRTKSGKVTIDLKSGTYRAFIAPDHGYTGSSSPPVQLRK